ncbi:MAG: nitroreductase family protein [Methanobacterium sp.]|uniref:nitroreductase family protein n=1 Tax=Methanobacterium sp. TaxID=2164 RepID=UPI003D65F09B|nr:nitroreductase family protein [Methanobacterium sp.]
MINREFKQGICINCGSCAVNCPMGLIQMNDFPKMAEGSEMMCNQCGHCEAICPEGAIRPIKSSTAMDKTFNTLTKSAEGWGISPVQMEFHMKFRRSIRNYKDKAVEKETLEKIFDIVRYAPSAGNGQPVEWIVFNDPQKVNEIAEASMESMMEISKTDSPLNDMIPLASFVETWENGMGTILREAPCLVVAHAAEDNMMAVGDGMIALTHLDLALPSFGLGGCWAGLFNIICNADPTLKNMLGIPKRNNIIYPFMVGYPKYEYQRIPERNKPNITWK